MMMQEKTAAKKLSKAVLDLKFMKKSKEKALVQEENEERQQLYQDQLSSLHEGAEKIIMVNSYVDCLKFLPCRLSFGGMDQDIEKLNEDKLMGLYTVVKPHPEESVTEMNTDISAKEMATHYRPKAQRPTPGHHFKQEEEEEEEEEYARPEEPSHDPASTPQDQKKPKGNNLRPIYNIDGRGGGKGKFGGGGWRGKRGGRGGKRGNFVDGRNFRGGRGGGYGGGRGRDGYVKEEGSWGAKQQFARGTLGGTAIRGYGQGDKRGREASQGRHQDSETWGHKKFKTERN